MAICHLQKSIYNIKGGLTQFRISVFHFLYFSINSCIFKIMEVQAKLFHFNECISARILEKLCISAGSVRIMYKRKYIKFTKSKKKIKEIFRSSYY